MSPRLPRNIRPGQVRRTVGLLEPASWNKLGEDERAAVDALSLHVWWRGRQEAHPAFEEADCVFLTVSWMQQLLRAVGARKTGEKAAREAINSLERLGLLVDTGEVKKPARPPQRVERAERFQPCGEPAREGGRDAQPTLSRSYWWRVFRIPALERVRTALQPQGAYAHVPDLPQHLASLSAFLRRQGLIARPRRRSRPNPGSVQWAFAHSGPP